MPHYLIIGTGVAGISAAEAIRSKDGTAKITVIGDEPEVYYSRPGLAYILTGEISESQLYPFDKEDFERLNLNFVKGLVSKIHPQDRTVALEDGQMLKYDKLLLALGADARKARYPGVEMEGVLKLDNFFDARKMIQLAKRAKSAVVVGGGITALEIVEGLAARGVKVHYLLRRDRYWGNVLDEAESRIVEHKLKEDGVVIHYQTDLDEILGKPGGLFGRGELRVTGIKTKDGKTIPCEILAFAIGIVPRIELAKDAGLETDRGILVNDYLQTIKPNIYAAGDVAQVLDPSTGKYVIDSLWPLARNQGHTAGLNMAGERTSYRKSIPYNVTRLAGLTTTIIGSIGGTGSDDDTVGIVRGDSETWREIPDAMVSQSGFDVNRIRLMVGDKTLLGAIVIGDQTLSRPIHQIVERQVDISSIRGALLHPKVDVADVIAKFWAENQAQH